ncbi:MAG: hypothetical protein HZA17_09665 [Nitrospirae bacterium]|nr:hypothetical protein [Nitrospirota bacterium]
MKKILYLFLLIMLFSCSSEKPSDITAKGVPGTPESGVAGKAQPAAPSDEGSYRLELTPSDITKKSAVSLKVKGINLSEAKVEWLVNGKPVSSELPYQFKAGAANKNDTIQARAVVKGKEVLSNILQVKNAPPEVKSVRLLPEVFKPGDNISVEVTGSDADGDDISYTYEWMLNSEPAGSDSRINVAVKRGDKLLVTIIPRDNDGPGRPVAISREIKNLPPVVVEDKKFTFDGKVYTYQFRATDPDDDPLTYSLKAAPAGMTISPETGVVRWNVPPDFKGKATFTAAANDGNGGEATQLFNVDISEQKKKK